MHTLLSSPPSRWTGTSPALVDVGVRQSRVPFVALLVVAAAAPFEPDRPLLSIAGFDVSALELVLAVGAGLAILTAGLSATRLRLPRSIVLPALAWLAVLALAAALAPMAGGNAWRFAGRAFAGAIVAVWTASVVVTVRDARSLVTVLVSTSVVVSGVAVLESLELSSVLSALTVFRPGFHVAGGQLRSTSTLAYPTIASMFLEVVFALGLSLLVVPGRGRGRGALIFLTLALIAAAIVATFTRAGLFSLAISLIVFAAVILHADRRMDAAVVRIGALGVVVSALTLTWQSTELLVARFTTATSAGWYDARYEAPAAIAVGTAERTRVPVTVVNTGRVTWQSTRQPVFALSYHWLDETTGRVIRFDGARTLFDRHIGPGERARVSAWVVAPGQPGCYTLVWDVVHEARAWFSTEAVPPARSRACVVGPSRPDRFETRDRLPSAVIRPDRLSLWKAAAGIAMDHPVLGIGPDNFRLAYGPYIGQADWDRRVHANNAYLEALTGTGVVGLLAFAWLTAALLLHLARQTIGHRDVERRALALGVLAAWLSIAGHGLVDSFMSFTPTYVIFAVTLGLGLSPALSVPREAHAHRI